MNKVYVVTSGCYSDYGIEAIFSTKEFAEEFINSRSFNIPEEIEEWCIDDKEHLDFIKKGLCYYAVELERNGDVASIKKSDGDVPYLGNRYIDLFEFYVTAKNEKHAIKIANERRSMMIANNLDRLKR